MKKILIVDDNISMLLLMQTLLAGKGWDAAISTCEEEIESILVSLKPDVLLLEVTLSYRDGRNITHDLKHDARFSKLRIVLFSSQSLDSESVADSYADDVLFKPFDLEELYQAVQPFKDVPPRLIK